jgi:iron complex transport system ATP-binding protein
MSLAPGSVRLEALGVCFSYGRPVVEDISLSLRAGMMTGIIGPNGSGKTTVLRLLDGILKPRTGEVRLYGTTPLNRLSRKEIARHITVVPQNGIAFHDATVFQFAMQGRSPHLSLLGFESARDEAIVFEALEMTSLEKYCDARISEISGGERQRLLLARALAQQAEILLLDEFTANLDINYQMELMRLVSRITRERNVATLVVSHEINLLGNYSDLIILMSQGKILAQGRLPEVLTAANLKRLFGMDFAVHLHADGTPEILPVMREREGS